VSNDGRHTSARRHTARGARYAGVVSSLVVGSFLVAVPASSASASAAVETQDTTGRESSAVGGLNAAHITALVWLGTGFCAIGAGAVAVGVSTRRSAARLSPMPVGAR